MLLLPTSSRCRLDAAIGRVRDLAGRGDSVKAGGVVAIQAVGATEPRAGRVRNGSAGLEDRAAGTHRIRRHLLNMIRRRHQLYRALLLAPGDDEGTSLNVEADYVRHGVGRGRPVGERTAPKVQPGESIGQARARERAERGRGRRVDIPYPGCLGCDEGDGAV